MTSPPSAPLSNGSLPAHRLRKPGEFRRVYDQGVRYPSTYFVAFCLRHRCEEPDAAVRASGPRFGITIPRAVGKAVVRNKIRRRLRELLRSRISRVNADCDIVFNPRRAVYGADFAVLARELDKVLARCSA